MALSLALAVLDQSMPPLVSDEIQIANRSTDPTAPILTLVPQSITLQSSRVQLHAIADDMEEMLQKDVPQADARMILPIARAFCERMTVCAA